MLLYLHKGTAEEQRPSEASDGFELVPVDYSEGAEGNFIEIEV